jgi:hypothetical protein
MLLIFSILINNINAQNYKFSTQYQVHSDSKENREYKKENAFKGWKFRWKVWVNNYTDKVYKVELKFDGTVYTLRQTEIQITKAQIEDELISKGYKRGSDEFKSIVDFYTKFTTMYSRSNGLQTVWKDGQNLFVRFIPTSQETGAIEVLTEDDGFRVYFNMKEWPF